VVYDANRFEPVPDDTLPVSILPDNRRYVFPYIGFELIEDQYETVTNFDQLQRVEDLHVGMRASARLGYSSTSAGSSATGWHFVGALSNGAQLGKNGTLLYGAELGGRLISSTAENLLLSTFANYHWRQTEKRLFYVGLDIAIGDNLDVDDPVMLGGDSGLRGYPLRYQAGSSRALLTIEQRWYTDWYPFRLFRVGAAAFVDVGQSWGYSPVGAESLGLLRDVGVGLRLGNPRSGVGRMLHIDLAFPLDGEPNIRGTQLLIEAKRSF
jgi:hemolysin activation/secretion protein